MESFWIIVLIVISSWTNKVTGEQAQHCMVSSCPCCASAPDGGSTICMSNNYCRYGCIDGIYGGKCYDYCPTYCTRCAREFGSNRYPNDYRVCYLCAEGYYNGTDVTDCSTPCPTNCMNNRCDKSTGRCLDGCTSDNWTGDKCDRCASGHYGGNCVPCPVYCKDDVCHTSNGGCTNGCKDAKFTGSKCDQCQTGKHGENCDETCPVNCSNGVCGRNNGLCTNGCTGNFGGDTCDVCKPYYYGENCNEVCSNCLSGQCDKHTGICDNCVGGYYGQYCNITCSSGCRNSQCYRYNATCTQGCWSAYSGDKCCVTNKNCELCDNVSTCSKCNSGFYGTSCGQTCPGRCAGGCDKISGDCSTCKNGFHGNKGTETCHKQCLDSKCGKQSGQCSACYIGFYGDSCNRTCPVTCRNKICYQDGGKCGDCVVGYHGLWCDLDCTTYCINETCIQETGACLYGCKEEHKDKCTQNNVVASDNVGTILGGVVGGLCVVIIILVVCLIHSRCRSKGTKENIEQEPNNGDELEAHDYEGLDEELKIEKTVYSDLQSDGEYVNTQI